MFTFKGFVRKLKWVVGLLIVCVVSFGGMVVFDTIVAESSEVSSVDVMEARRQERAARAARAKVREEERRLLMAQREKEDNERRENFERELEEERKKFAELRKKIASSPPKKRTNRRVRRWKWMSHPEKVAQTWNVPKKESQEAEITGLLRICTSEQEGSESDCIGIYQVISNVKSRSCNRKYINLITECDDNGETLLSAMRRASRYVVGIAPAKYARQRWISEMTTACNMPKSFPATVRRYCKRKNLNECAQDIWSKQHEHHCEATTKLVTGLIDGTNKKRLTGARVVAWGGRCEVPRGACDDPWGCAQGLVRVPQIERMAKNDRPANAFWCRRGTPGCGVAADPVCIAMGFGDDSKKGKIVKRIRSKIKKQRNIASSENDTKTSLQDG